jgi:hypothetical protein
MSVITDLIDENSECHRRIAELESALETERMRLAACGTAALGYFNGCLDEYKSASLDDVLRLRADLEGSAESLRLSRDHHHDQEIEYRRRWTEVSTELSALKAQEPVAVLYRDGAVLTKAECGTGFDICCKVETPLYAAPVVSAEQQGVADGLTDLCRFLAKIYCELDELRYSTAKLPAEQIPDCLICKWTVVQGTRNQLNLKRISEQPYDAENLHAAITHLLAAAAPAPLQPVNAQPDDEDEYMPAGIVEGIMRSGTVDAVSMAAQSLRAKPAGCE